MLEALVYISTPTSDLDQADVQNILEKSRHNNMRADLTGLLMFSGYLFMQVLEGDTAALDVVIENIRSDSRHEDLTMLSREPVADRVFGDWTMAFRNVEKTSMDHLCGEVGWNVATQKLMNIPSHRNMAFLTTTITTVIGKPQYG